MSIASRIISYLFQPIFMPLLGVFLLFNVDSAVISQSHPDAVERVLVLLGGLTVLMPLFSLYVMYNSRVIADLELKRRKDRIPAFFMTLFYFGAAYYLMATYLPEGTIHQLIFSALTGALIAMVISALITISWKISIHMVGISGILGIFVALPRVVIQLDTGLIIGLILLSGLIGSARMREGAHNLAQIFAGFMLGFLCEYFCILTEFRF